MKTLITDIEIILPEIFIIHNYNGVVCYFLVIIVYVEIFQNNKKPDCMHVLDKK